MNYNNLPPKTCDSKKNIDLSNSKEKEAVTQKTTSHGSNGDSFWTESERHRRIK